MDELSEMLKSLGEMMAEPINQPPINMALVTELLDIQVMRVIKAPLDIFEEAEADILEAECNDNQGNIDACDGSVEVDDVDPLPLLTLVEARICAYARGCLNL